MGSIDQEWKQFLLSMQSDQIDPDLNLSSLRIQDDDDEDESQSSTTNENISDDEDESITEKNKKNANNNPIQYIREKCEELYISTQTQIFFLNQTNLDVNEIFWNMPIIEYGKPMSGVIKKQMRCVFKNRESFDLYSERLKTIPYYTEKIMKQINNPNARKIKFKDERKITIGISKKDIMNCHGKVKKAFINCFAIILRVKDSKNCFHEFHVKVFNTGKLAIPGIVDDDLLETTKKMILDILQPNFKTPLCLISANESPLIKKIVKNKKGEESNTAAKKSNYEEMGLDTTIPLKNIKKQKNSHVEYVKPKENVLINSNFNCGYYIDQDKIKHVLQHKYGLNPTYNKSMYPAVKCKFYYNNELADDISLQNGKLSKEDQNVTMTELDQLLENKYTKISFMIFRTGNCLIVGNCTKKVLMFVFEYLKKILMDEYENVRTMNDIITTKQKKNKPRKKKVVFTKEYYQTKIQPMVLSK